LYLSFQFTRDVLNAKFSTDYNPGLGYISGDAYKGATWVAVIVVYIITIALFVVAYRMLKKAFAVDKSLATPPPAVPPQQ
jgi:hypothetical protein